MMIAQQMTRGQWTRNRLKRRAMAAEWGVTVESLMNDACEASRLLRLDGPDLDALRVENVHWMLETAEDARSRENSVTGLPDFRAAIEARKLAAEYAGVKLDAPPSGEADAPKRIEIVVLPTPEKKPEPK